MNILNNIKTQLNQFIKKNNWNNWIVKVDNDTLKLINTKTNYQYAQWNIHNWYNDYDFVQYQIEKLLKWMSEMNII